MKIIDRSKEHAHDAHAGQKDLAGEDYIIHVSTVAHLVSKLTDDEETIAIAWLHDTIEDTDATIHDERYKMYPKSVLDGITQLTRPKHYPYKDYIREITSEKSKLVKIADLLHNQDDSRLPIGRRSAKRRKKYHDALLYLLDHDVERYNQMLLLYKQESKKYTHKG